MLFRSDLFDRIALGNINRSSFSFSNSEGGVLFDATGKALIIQREQMEAYAQDVISRYELGKKGLDTEEQKLIKDIILGILEIASKGAGTALGAKVGKTGFQ